MNGIPTPDGARKGATERFLNQIGNIAGQPLGLGARSILLQAATDALGQVAVAEALNIQPRSLRAKLSMERQIADSDLRSAVSALAARSDELARLAASIQDAML